MEEEFKRSAYYVKQLNKDLTNKVIDDEQYFILYAKEMDNLFEIMSNKVNRFEVINHKRNDLPIGRYLVHKDVIDISYQDDYMTLKVFI
jgi:hypothetical protein